MKPFRPASSREKDSVDTLIEAMDYLLEWEEVADLSKDSQVIFNYCLEYAQFEDATEAKRTWAQGILSSQAKLSKLQNLASELRTSVSGILGKPKRHRDRSKGMTPRGKFIHAIRDISELSILPDQQIQQLKSLRKLKTKILTTTWTVHGCWAGEKIGHSEKVPKGIAFILGCLRELNASNLQDKLQCIRDTAKQKKGYGLRRGACFGFSCAKGTRRAYQNLHILLGEKKGKLPEDWDLTSDLSAAPSCCPQSK